MNDAEALEIIKRHKGTLTADHRYPEYYGDLDREVIFRVTMWGISNPSVGATGGGDTLAEATQMAVRGLDRVEK